MTTIDSAIDQQAERIRIGQLRRTQNSTLVQLAVSSDLSHPFLSQLERGRVRPGMTSVEKVARAPGSSQFELTLEAEDDAGDSICFAGGIRHHLLAAEPGGYRLLVVKEKPESR